MNIYVAQFDLQWNDKDLENLFSPFGNVEAATVEIDAFTERSRGFGYVEMSDDEQAKKAIAGLNDKLIGQHTLKVQEAEPKEVKKGSYKVGSGSINPYRFKKN